MAFRESDSISILSKLAWRNLWRNYRRTLITLTAIIIVVWAMILFSVIIRGDIVMTHTDLDTYWNTVANISYSWNWDGKNISGVFEYFHNGLGLKEKDYDKFQRETDFVARL